MDLFWNWLSKCPNYIVSNSIIQLGSLYFTNYSHVHFVIVTYLNIYSRNILRTDPRFNLIFLKIQIMGANSMLPILCVRKGKYVLISFQGRDTKLVKCLAENHYLQRKLCSSGFWASRSHLQKCLVYSA